MSFFSKKLGIDLGTANTLVFVPGKGVVLNEPSVVAISLEDNKILAVGNEAKIMIGRTPKAIVAYRPMKDGVIADYKVTEAMLSYYMKKAMGGWGFIKPEVLISVPAGVTSTERRAVIEAAIKAGAKNAYVVKEPILAAIGAGIPIYEARGHMVADIGGGTTDVAVISLGGIVSATSVKCAGNKIDESIIDYIKKTFNLAIGDKTAEDIKVKIGSALPIDEELVISIKGRDFISGLPRSVEIKTNEIVKAISRELREIIKAIKDVLQETPPELAADIMDHGIIMTGGTSALRNLPELIFRRVGVKAILAENPLYCVAEGTGIALEHLGAYKRVVASKR
ncbi:MAG: rod shape-determining protein [Candidatus Zambryskibacteria bacterium RIFCSPLOWO2_01_FULL_39_39]|uniref:Cell shape-determining protein MreB n=1 Tax=Candidatus Zambryskibacteria bacterium RIFCSPLOWO2_01_FULL_39_39 TaxID=1802758 RepID=A0A1G2TVP2_9BACT|nr:MAG: Rod shape-determining protein MreB [Parcubacteria group bacterium GW2011_GWA1_38_7]OHA86574.1 MAG: rod shape-determining protein [Candidatus Zambryskibacteria bacterium RIFCSPHIGHO2_01_FULL_39_63]OHA94257.1 MAG: rod shape-determining protein [Candidatus Zambryskibacteria bacterium RIFCSPHIGHO2_02_FULL_39_19]OHA98476.1 MAG: rod shape-determining protein [Candidatus Zambryskibacteria bacterium RIFCSPHIGHO2_12_FULL_39_21]OHB01395.1 MAG: rod shape-determining protein [Candidatus Zambryskiba